MFNSNNTKKHINSIYCPAIREVDSSRRSCNLLHAAVWSQVACVIDLVHANTYFKDFFIVRGSVSLSTSFNLAIDSYLPSPREEVRKKNFITGLFRQILRGSVPVWAIPSITTSPHRRRRNTETRSFTFVPAQPGTNHAPTDCDLAISDPRTPCKFFSIAYILA